MALATTGSNASFAALYKASPFGTPLASLVNLSNALETILLNLASHRLAPTASTEFERSLLGPPLRIRVSLTASLTSSSNLSSSCCSRIAWTKALFSSEIMFAAPVNRSAISSDSFFVSRYAFSVFSKFFSYVEDFKRSFSIISKRCATVLSMVSSTSRLIPSNASVFFDIVAALAVVFADALLAFSNSLLTLSPTDVDRNVNSSSSAGSIFLIPSSALFHFAST